MKSYRNKLLRKRVFERDQGYCAKCRAYDPKWEADHVTALWEGGKDTLENLQTLCRHCHMAKTVKDTPIRAKADRLRERHETMKARRSIRPAERRG